MISAVVIFVLLLIVVLELWYIGYLKIDLNYERSVRKMSEVAYDKLHEHFMKYFNRDMHR